MPEQTREERINELLEQSGTNAASAIKGPSLSDLVPVEPRADAKDLEEEETPTGGKKVRIPASRLKTLTSKVEQLEAQLQERNTYADRVAALEQQLASKGEEDIPEWWTEAYGDTDVAKKGYKDQQRVMREELKRSMAEQDAQRQAVEAERTARIESIEQSFDDQMDELEETLGRTLTATQKGELLDIVGEYSPMDGGKYVAYMPVEKAYDIWTKSQGDAGKRAMADLGAIQSSGSTATPSPDRPQMGDWRKRFPGL